MIEGVNNEKYHNKRKDHGMTPTRRVVLSFLLVILVGSILLTLPITNKGEVGSYVDNLFTAVSAVCVTGLVTVVPLDQYNTLGHIVILLMIQIGGLGFLTFLSLIIAMARKRLTLEQKLVAQEALNRSSLNTLSTYIKKIIKFTLINELIGAIILSTQFIGKYGFIKGSWYGLFHSVSAFCNAGFDLLGNNSLINYQGNVVVNLTIATLIIMGGLGFIVWFDIAQKFKDENRRLSRFNKKHFLRSLSLHSKVAIVTTISLLVVGTILFWLFEYNNVLANKDIGHSLLISFFESTTLRTAGFTTVDIQALHPVTKFFMSIFMFIGGSPAGTAGGIKTVTFAIIVLETVNIYRGGKELVLKGKRIKKRIIIRAMSLFLFSLVLCFSALMIVSVTENKSFIDLAFEVFSAFGTVGLSASVTPYLSVGGKCVIMALMYIGRIGPTAMMISFVRKSQLQRRSNSKLMYPDEDVLIG